jgi:predicted GIY-YIG superfamily endonuclease
MGKSINEWIGDSVTKANIINANSPVTSNFSWKSKEKKSEKLTKSARRKQNHWIIYTLALQHGCYYVGRTTVWAYGKRMNAHWSGRGSEWTKLHLPVKPVSIEIVPIALTGAEAESYENARTIEVAKVCGTDFVRGGGYCQVATTPSWPRELR